MPRSAVSMPSVAAIGSASKRTMASALMPPMTRHIDERHERRPAGIGQPMREQQAKSVDEMPTIEPIERSTTPASSAKPEKAPTISGTTRKVPMIETLPNDRNFGPTQKQPDRDHRR